jgi:dTMP kinase
MNSMPGLFLTFEGIDGCGKSTQLEMVARVLRLRGRDVLITREPGGTQIGEGVRELLLSDASVGIVPKTELFLIVGARAEHTAALIRPALDAGRVVLSDRYIDSTVAFQGYGRQLDLEMVKRMNAFATDRLLPDLTLVFDLDPALARARLHKRPVGGLLGAFDDERAEFHARVREGYLTLAKQEPSRVQIIDASGPVDETHARVMSTLLRFLGEG